ncbi:MAG TPA: hypothetical protein VKJ77_17440, partial [Caballeronia sp.]|nr:hypothetical protein [Caballeronia sp.]
TVAATLAKSTALNYASKCSGLCPQLECQEDQEDQTGRKIHKHRCPANLSSPGIGFLLSAKLRL